MYLGLNLIIFSKSDSNKLEFAYFFHTISENLQHCKPHLKNGYDRENKNLFIYIVFDKKKRPALRRPNWIWERKHSNGSIIGLIIIDKFIIKSLLIT